MVVRDPVRSVVRQVVRGEVRDEVIEKFAISAGLTHSAMSFTSDDPRNLFDANGLLDIDGAPAETARRSILGGNGYFWADGSVTNSLLHNRDLSNAAWTNNGATQDATGIDGVANTAWTFSGTDDANQTIAVPNDSNTHRPTWYLEKNGGVAILTASFSGGSTTLDYIATVDTSDGSAVASGDAVAADISVVDVGDWYWVQVEAANNSTGNTTFTYDIDVSSGTFVYDMGGVFLNQEAPLHVFETAGSAVSVDAEDASLTLGSWFNQSQWTLIIEMWTPILTSNSDRVFAEFSDGTTSNRAWLGLDASGRAKAVMKDGGADQFDLRSTGAVTGGALQKLALAVKAGEARLYLNGAEEDDDATVVMPTVSDAAIGSAFNGFHANAGIKKVLYIPRFDTARAIAETTL